MTPIAPGRFSITKGWPSESCNWTASTRAIWSGKAPGGNGTTDLTAALNRPAEFGVHVRGALNNGCTAEEIREVLLLVALYCGIPAANEAHRLAKEIIGD